MPNRIIRLLTLPAILLNLTWIVFLVSHSLRPNPTFPPPTSYFLPTNPNPSPSPSPSLTPNTQSLKPISIVAVGDIMLGREVNFQARKFGDFYPFEKIASITKTANITFGNLESPFFESCPETHGGITFCARPEMVSGLVLSGFDVLSIENNHNLNYGQSGRDQTIALLTKNTILPSSTQIVIKKIPTCSACGTFDICGTCLPADTSSEVLTKEEALAKEGDTSDTSVPSDTFISLGFLSFDLTVTNTSTQLIKSVTEASPKVDYLVVSLHWGVEYEKEPRAWQKTLAHQIIDSGASLIIGHHTHVTQPVETYNGKLIFYSLGNFVFDQMWSDETRKGLIAKIQIQPDGTQSYELIPTLIYDNAQPRPI